MTDTTTTPDPFRTDNPVNAGGRTMRGFLPGIRFEAGTGEGAGEAAAATVPDWVPEKFRGNPQQFADSYTELERRLTEATQHSATLEQNYGDLVEQTEQLQAQLNQPQAQQGAADPIIAQYVQAMEVGDYPAALAIQAQIAQLAAQQTVQQALPQVGNQVQQLAGVQQTQVAESAANALRAQYGEAFTEAEPAMRDLLVQSPHLYPDEARYDVEKARAAFDTVFKLATYGSQPAPPQNDVAEMKRLAQSAQGAGARPLTPDEQAAEFEAIKAAAPKTYYGG